MLCTKSPLEREFFLWQNFGWIILFSIENNFPMDGSTASNAIFPSINTHCHFLSSYSTGVAGKFSSQVNIMHVFVWKVPYKKCIEHADIHFFFTNNKFQVAQQLFCLANANLAAKFSIEYHVFTGTLSASHGVACCKDIHPFIQSACFAA